jgi:hypothetical protein
MIRQEGMEGRRERRYRREGEERSSCFGGREGRWKKIQHGNLTPSRLNRVALNGDGGDR